MSKLTIKERYGVTPNHILNDKNLSMKSKGLFAYIQSKPENWDFSVQRIELQTNDGRDSISSGLKELEDAGYLRRIKYKNEKGQWDWEYHLTDNPVKENPSLDNPEIYSKKDIVRKSSNKENNFSKEKLKSDISSATHVVTKQNSVINSTEGGNTTEEYQRVAVNEDGEEISPRKKADWSKERAVEEQFREACVKAGFPRPVKTSLFLLKVVKTALASVTLDEIPAFIDWWLTNSKPEYRLNIHSAFSTVSVNRFRSLNMVQSRQVAANDRYKNIKKISYENNSEEV